MTSERARQIERICQAALERDGPSRVAFLAEACAGDDPLRRDVDSLLAQESDAVGFLSTPVVAPKDERTSDGASFIGRQLGPYAIQARLGAGGMGEVYRARDTKLGRDVAIKILPRAFTNDPDRLARFEREARMLAALNHPHIGAIYGLEDVDGVPALVLELVEGETLAEKLTHGSGLMADGSNSAKPLAMSHKPSRGLDVSEALAIARQIADALEAAHEKGIIHRDLKPANIKITPDGTVKVLDFGLAKAATGDRAVPDLTQSPPVAVGGTSEGVILGTAAYMSPEQARGQAVDKRTDIWAFGCVLYELLCSRLAFPGNTPSDAIATILGREPEWNALPATTPASIRHLLQRCLQKDPKRRLHDIADARIEIDDVITGAATSPHVREVRRLRLAWSLAGAIAALIVGTLAAGLVVGRFTGGPTERSPGVARVLVGVAPADELAPQPTRTAVAFSPDGKHLVFSATKGGRQQLYVRPMDRLEATPKPGTEGSNSPFFSPDGRWVGFWTGQMSPGAEGELKKVPLDGGPAVTLCNTAPLFGASWGTDDTIVFANFNGGLWRVSAGGGTPQPLTTVDANKGERSHRLPQVLPGGRAVLFTVQRGTRWDTAQVAIRSLATGEQRVLVEGGADARYVPTGHLVYARAGTLMAVSFDVAHRVVTSAPTGIVGGIMQAENAPFISLNDTGAAQFSVSESGALVYLPGGIFPTLGSSLMWVERNGTATPVGLPPGAYMGPRFSADGQHLAVSSRGTNSSSVWILDVSRDTFTRLTEERENNLWPAWTPDGKRITWALDLRGLFSIPVDGSGVPERLLGENRIPGSWSPDGKVLAFIKRTSTTGNEIWTVGPSGGERKLRPSLQTPVDERYPEFSPDGHWLAYATDESGRFEVYVQRYPGSGERQQVSTEGGAQPAWAQKGRELVYTVGGPSVLQPTVNGHVSIKVMAADVTLGPTFRVGTPRVLFEGKYLVSTPLRDYDVTSDGKRFVMNQLREQPTPPPATQMVVVLNWFEELKQRVPVK